MFGAFSRTNSHGNSANGFARSSASREFAASADEDKDLPNSVVKAKSSVPNGRWFRDGFARGFASSDQCHG